MTKAFTFFNANSHEIYFTLHNVKATHKIALGTGEFDLAKYLHLARTQDHRAVLEVKTVVGLRKSVNWLKERSYICETNRK